jgi:transcriptional regulator with XRE-family HTH domain
MATPFSPEELASEAPDAVREAFVERSAAFEAGDLVRLMREKASLTQKELAQRISTSQSHLSEVERGNGLQGPTFSMLRKVANACHVDLRLEIGPEAINNRFADMTRDQRDAFAAGLDVSKDRVDQALMAARDKALAILSMGFLVQVLKDRPEIAHAYGKWLREAKRF